MVVFGCRMSQRGEYAILVWGYPVDTEHKTFSLHTHVLDEEKRRSICQKNVPLLQR